MRSTLAAMSVLVFLAACGDKEAEEEEGTAADDTAASGEEGGEEGAGDDTGTGGGDLVPADIQGGQYRMVVTEVTDNTCLEPLEVGMSRPAPAPGEGGVVMLWGYAKVMTDGGQLLVSGTKAVDVPDVDCVIEEKLTGKGPQTSTTAFSLDIVKELSGEGAACEGVPCTQVFSADFTLDEGGADGGGSEGGGTGG